MVFKFIGKYTNGHTTIDAGGVLFEGHEPSDVADADLIRRLSNNPEFVAVDPLDHDGDGKKGGSLDGEQATAKRPYRRKAAK